jgi:hypothetical protein
MTKALSGAEARGQTDTPSNIPYNSAFAYNPFGQRTNTTVTHWGHGPTSKTVNYEDNRRTGTLNAHDADGNLIQENQYRLYGYDASSLLGEMVHEFTGSQPEEYILEQDTVGHDGDGQAVRVETYRQYGEEDEFPMHEIAYKIRSTVLGGQSIYEKDQAAIVGGGRKIATAKRTYYPSEGIMTMWHHGDPNGKSYRSTDSNGNVMGDGVGGADWDKIETDATGKSVGLSAPTFYPSESFDLYTSGWSFGLLSNGQHTTYSVDGIHVPEEYFWNVRLTNRHGSLGLELLDFGYRRDAERWYRRTQTPDPPDDIGPDEIPNTADDVHKVGSDSGWRLVDTSWSLIALLSPQTEEKRLDDDEVAKLLADIDLIFENNPDCESFIQNVIANLSVGTGPLRNGNLKEILKEVHKKGGIWFRKNMDNNHATGGWDNAEINLDPPVRYQVVYSPDYTTPRSRRIYNRQQEIKVAAVALAEALHHAGKYFDDFYLYEAYARWKKIDMPDYPTTPPIGQHSRWISFWSARFHPRMKDSCNFTRVPVN